MFETTCNVLLQYIFILLYGLIMTIGIGGNIMVIFTVLRWGMRIALHICVWWTIMHHHNHRSRALQTRSNMYICNMALSDIIICCLAAPVTPLTAFTGAWHLGPLLCSLVPFVQVTGWLMMSQLKDDVSVHQRLHVNYEPHRGGGRQVHGCVHQPSPVQ